MEDLKYLFRENFLRYASYVILDRAIPELIDGLKPVQRRILWTLFLMDDGKLHKVANVAGQTMALHPHGDGPITEALVNLANKGYLLDAQGNFGNPLTGDPAAASRYIETRLSELAKETLFNPKLTLFSPSYDSRANEPVFLPAKIPLLLMQGAEGIAVGMTTKIFPHNFNELLEAQIALLKGEKITLYPDFSSGGLMDISEYEGGKGKIRLRAKIEISDDKTLLIKQICYGTTTESLIKSIDEAAKKGKLKIDSINDYTAENIEIEIKLPRGQYAHEVIDALYAFTECEMTLHPQMLAIKEKLPWEGTAETILENHLFLLQSYLRQELEIERNEILEKVFRKLLEQIFIENRLYKKIEESKTYEKIHAALEKGLEPFYEQLNRIPEQADREYLLSIPIRRISIYDQEKNRSDIAELKDRIVQIEKNLKNLKKFTIAYLSDLLKKYGEYFPRKTEIQSFGEVDVKKLSVKKVKVSYDEKTGYLGTKVTGKSMECLNSDKLLILFQDGSYSVMNIPEKQYIHTQGSHAVWICVADRKSVVNVIYKDNATDFAYAKRFIVKQFILEKSYRYLPENTQLAFISVAEEEKVQLSFKPKGKIKGKTLAFEFSDVAVKGVDTKGVRIANTPLKGIEE